MNNREKEILAILRRNPLIQQNEIADMLQISRSRVAAHIMDLMRKGRIKGKGYILTEQEYCVVVGTINMDIRGMADIRYPQAASHPGTIHCSAGGVGRNIAHNLALLGRDVHLLSVIGDDFYGEMLLEETRRAGVNVSGCVRLHGQSTSTYLAIANRDDQTVLAINDTHLLEQLTPQLLNGSRDLLRHAGVVLADCNLTAEALEWVFTLAVELVDEDYNRSVSHPAHFHQLARLHLHAFCHIDHDDNAIDCRQCAVGVFGKVLVSRSVEDVDFVVAIVKTHYRRCHRYASLLLDFHPV